MIGVCLPILLYWIRRNPDPRFRPRFGEIVLMSLVIVLGSSVSAFLLRGIFSVDDIARSARSGPGYESPNKSSSSSDDQQEDE